MLHGGIINGPEKEKGVFLYKSKNSGVNSNPHFSIGWLLRFYDQGPVNRMMV
jgi:hypothetical protein